jgi:hypothetical protein
MHPDAGEEYDPGHVQPEIGSSGGLSDQWFAEMEVLPYYTEARVNANGFINRLEADDCHQTSIDHHIHGSTAWMFDEAHCYFDRWRIPANNEFRGT